MIERTAFGRSLSEVVVGQNVVGVNNRGGQNIFDNQSGTAMNQSSLVRDDFFSLRGEYYGPTKKDEIYINYLKK